MKIFTPQKNRGYTLLFAVLVSSLVLAIGISILTVSKKEFLLATSSRDSAAALYAADGGIECAAYWDQHHDVFSTTTSSSGNVRCGDAYSPIVRTISATATSTFRFSVKFGGTAASCSSVTVRKGYSGGGIATIIEARGYNLGWNPDNLSCDVVSAKKVERALRLTY